MEFWNEIKDLMMARAFSSMYFFTEELPTLCAYGTKCKLEGITLGKNGDLTLHTNKGTLKGILPKVDENTANMIRKEFSLSIWERISYTPNEKKIAVDFLQVVCNELYCISKGDVEFDTIKGIVASEVAKVFALLPLKVLGQIDTE